MTRLPIPIFRDDKIYREIEIDKPFAKNVAETQKIAKAGMPYKALNYFLKNCIKKIDEVEDEISIASLIPKMPFRSAEYIAQQIMINYYIDDDGVEGYYECPVCETPSIARHSKDDGIEIDTRDFMSDMKVNYYEGDNNFIFRELTKPVTIKDKDSGQIIEEITSIKMEYPTLEHAIISEQKYNIEDEIKMQFGMYVEALTEVNGNITEKKWKNRYGMFFFEHIKEVKDDLGYISKEVKQYGLDRSFKKECRKCGKIWRAIPNTSNFFGSALLSLEQEEGETMSSGS